ncbi:MAG: T9SS type A sorting domain-containing protein [Rhodothermales bacterium]|nr:T9SS type A sorting domain-containing protein [Rhodothermales bacterium]
MNPDRIISAVFLTVVLTTVAPSVSQPFTFEFVTQQLRGVSFSDVGWIDVNSDGYLDVALAGNWQRATDPRTYSGILLHLESGRRSFPANPTRPFTSYGDNLLADASGLWHSSMAWDDFDRDGDLDMILSGTRAQGGAGAQIALLRNDGVDGFTATTPSIDPTYAGSLTTGDFDNDGDVDVLITGFISIGTRIARIFTNNGSGTFELTADLEGVGYGASTTGDYDNDGDLDLVIIGERNDGSFSADLYRNDRGTFTNTNTPLTGVAYGAVAWGDFDSDNDLDLAICGARPGPRFLQPTTQIYSNDGAILIPINTDVADLLACSLAWGDLDQDGLPELVVSGARDLVSRRGMAAVYRGQRDSGFSLGATFPGMYPARVKLGDYDLDSDLDLLLAGYSRANGPTTNQYQNGVPSINSPPEAPGTVTSDVDGHSATISWTRGTDEQSGPNGLSYNLKISSVGDGSIVMSANTLSPAGSRQMSGPGNVQHNVSWTLRDLAAGDYVARVQAIDPSYAASEFSAESYFSIRSDDIAVTVAEDVATPTYQLTSAYPNPFVEQTTIRYEIPRPEPLELVVFDVMGRRVKSLRSGLVETGVHTSVWTGETDAGILVAKGLYFISLASPSAGVLVMPVIRL